MTPEEVLLKAADAIAEHGHCKYQYLNTKNEMCAYGAMTTVVIGNANYTGATDLWTTPSVNARDLIDQAADLLSGVISDPHRVLTFSRITRFNDDPETTGEDVILAMKRAAHHE